MVQCTSAFSCFLIQCAPARYRTVLPVPASKDWPSDTARSRAAKTAVSARFVAALAFECTADALASAPMRSAEDAVLSAVSLPQPQACKNAVARNTAHAQETEETGGTRCACIFKAALPTADQTCAGLLISNRAQSHSHTGLKLSALGNPPATAWHHRQRCSLGKTRVIFDTTSRTTACRVRRAGLA